MQEKVHPVDQYTFIRGIANVNRSTVDNNVLVIADQGPIGSARRAVANQMSRIDGGRRIAYDPIAIVRLVKPEPIGNAGVDHGGSRDDDNA